MAVFKVGAIGQKGVCITAHRALLLVCGMAVVRMLAAPGHLTDPAPVIFGELSCGHVHGACGSVERAPADVHHANTVSARRTNLAESKMHTS